MDKMKYIFVAVLSALVCFCLVHKCSGKEKLPAQPVRFNRDSAMKVIRTEIEEINSLHKATDKKDSIQKVYITRWMKVKADTIHETKTQIVNTCDSTIAKDTALVNSLKKENGSQKKIIGDLLTVNKVDSVNYAARGDTIQALNKEVKKSRRKGYIKGFCHGVAAGGVIGGVVDGALR